MDKPRSLTPDPPRRGSLRPCNTNPDFLGVPEGNLGERRGSKVRFSGSDIAIRKSDEDIHIDPTLQQFLKTQSGSSRRGSLSPSIRSENGSLSAHKPRKRLSSKYESLDYNVVESQRFIQEKELLTPENLQRASMARWFVNFLVGVYVAFIAIVVALCISYISKYKFMLIYHLLEDCDTVVCLLPGALTWMAINGVLILIGAYIVTYHAPQAAGSGIPQIKCYLNGIKLPGLLSVKTLLAKAGGVILSVGGGLACGKEGPMIHSGAICASGLSHGEFYCIKKSCKPGVTYQCFMSKFLSVIFWGTRRVFAQCCDPLRSDEERRDFVAAGAASGVSAAFASPVGGVLFSLEEGASFLNQTLTWRMLFSSMTASLMLNIIMSAIKGHPEDMSNPGLVSLGYIGDISFKTFEIPIFMLMALVGGLSGAFFIQLNYKMTLFRRRVITRNWMKVGEAVLVACCSAVILMVLIYAVPDCQPIRGYVAPNETLTLAHSTNISDVHQLHRRAVDHYGGPEHGDPHNNHTQQDAHGHGAHGPYGDHGPHGYVFKGFCPYGQHNRMADILFKTPEGGLHAMLHGSLDEWSFVPLLILVAVYHLLATWTYGLMVSSGVFIPSLLIGAVWGRVIGMIVMKFIPKCGVNIAKYALVGAACQLGGTVRMTISLTVIIIECTGDITFGIPIMLSLIVAKWMGDYFNTGIYDLHIEIMGIPLLPWDPPAMCHTVKASDVMSTPVIVFRTVEKIGRIVKIIEGEGPHNGFPVVEDYDPYTSEFNSEATFGRLKGFILRSQLQQILLSEGEVTEEEMDSLIDLRMHMDISPYVVHEDVSLPKIFKLFRGLGLRHLIVVDDRNRVSGMITRLNLAKFRSETVKGQLKVEELEVEG